MADVGRSRRKGGDVRDRPPDRLPQPRAVAREVREIRMRLSVLALAYRAEHEALIALGSSDVSVTSSPGSQTEATTFDAENAAARNRCRLAAAYLHAASANIEAALAVFGPDATQRDPDADPYSQIDRPTYNRALHYKREREMRSS